MHLECHAALGWVIANCGKVDRRVRNYVVVSAILPDIDAIPYVFGPVYYGLYHHTFGHNVFLWALCALWGAWRFRSWKAGALGFVAFGSHLLTDAYLSKWFLYLFWPVSHKGYMPEQSLDLSSPVNTYLLYSTPLVIAAVALIWKRTPLEWISPKLDALFISFFLAKKEHCSECGGGANMKCEECGRDVCPRHLQVSYPWRVQCVNCQRAGPEGR